MFTKKKKLFYLGFFIFLLQPAIIHIHKYNTVSMYIHIESLVVCKILYRSLSKNISSESHILI